MPLFLAPLLCIAAALVFGAEARSTSALAERVALRCVDRFSLLTLLPATAAGLVLDASWSLLGAVDDVPSAFGIGLAASAALSAGVSVVARVASRSNLPQSLLRGLGFGAFAISGVFVVGLGISRGARAVLPLGALPAVAAAAVIALVTVSMILSLQAATQLRPEE